MFSNLEELIYERYDNAVDIALETCDIDKARLYLESYYDAFLDFFPEITGLIDLSRKFLNETIFVSDLEPVQYERPEKAEWVSFRYTEKLEKCGLEPNKIYELLHHHYTFQTFTETLDKPYEMEVYYVYNELGAPIKIYDDIEIVVLSFYKSRKSPANCVDSYE